MFGFVTFELVDTDSYRIELISGKRLYPNPSFFPEDTFDRVISAIDSESRDFLRRSGRSLAVGIAIGALESVEDLIEERKESIVAETGEAGSLKSEN